MELTGEPLEAESLYRFFHAGEEETLALQGVSLAVGVGEVVAVTGPSGSGKSTLLGCLSGVDEPDGGMVRIVGERLSRQAEGVRARVRGRKIGMLFQQGNLVGHLSVADNVRLARRMAGRGHHAATSLMDLLKSCQIDHRANVLPAQLSGGELVRGGLAVALANEPPVILADEPTGELDEGTARNVIDLLRVRADQGAAVLIVTHDREIADQADREIPLNDGRVVST